MGFSIKIIGYNKIKLGCELGNLISEFGFVLFKGIRPDVQLGTLHIAYVHQFLDFPTGAHLFFDSDPFRLYRISGAVGEHKIYDNRDQYDIYPKERIQLSFNRDQGWFVGFVSVRDVSVHNDDNNYSL